MKKIVACHDSVYEKNMRIVYEYIHSLPPVRAAAIKKHLESSPHYRPISQPKIKPKPFEDNPFPPAEIMIFDMEL